MLLLSFFSLSTGNAGDNNQAPMRNPPDALHNSAGALAQHNLVGVIIQAIKMQSLGIFKRLTNLIQNINECETTAKAVEDLKAVGTLRKEATLTTIAVIRKTIQKYVHKIQKLTNGLATSMVKMIKSTVFMLRQQLDEQQQQQQQREQHPQQEHQPRQLRKNLIIENEFKTFKHFSTQETHVSRHEKHCKMWRRKLRKSRLCYLHDKMTMTSMMATTTLKQQQHQDNSDFMANLYVNNFQQHIKQQEILHKFNTIYVTHIFKTTANSNSNMFINSKSNNNNNNNTNKHNIVFMANTLYWLIILLCTFILTLTLIINFLPKSFVNPRKFFSNTYNKFLSQHLFVLLLQQFLHVVVNNILRHMTDILCIVLSYLTSVYSKFSLYLNSTPSPHTATTLILPSSAAASLALSESSLSSISSSTSSSSVLPCSTLLFCR